MDKPASGPQIQLRAMFPTPIAVLALPDAARLNHALEARILAREQVVPSVRHSNQGGWQSPDDFTGWGGPEGTIVLDAARQVAGQLTARRDGAPAILRWRMNAWANVNRNGQGNEFHTHPGAFWSASYYVRDGGCATDASMGGEFEVQDPRGVAPAMLAPELCFRTPGGQSVGASETLRPIAGTLVVFPSWLSHAVRAYRGRSTRISIAINLTPVQE